MNATGRELVEGALDLILEPGEGHDVENVNLIVRQSKFIIDSINSDASVAVGGVERVVVNGITAPSFTWGPGGDVNRTTLPSDLVSWNAIDPGPPPAQGAADPRQEYGRGGHFLTTEEWSNLQFLKEDTADRPQHLYWPKTLNNVGQYTIFIWPTPSGPVNLAIYAAVPKFDRLDLNTTYRLDVGRGEYLMTQLALHAAPLFGFDPSPQLRQRARDAAIRLGSFSREDGTLQPASPRYLIGHHNRHGYSWVG